MTPFLFAISSAASSHGHVPGEVSEASEGRGNDVPRNITTTGGMDVQVDGS